MKLFPLTLLQTTSRRPEYMAVSLAVAFTTVGVGVIGLLLLCCLLAFVFHVPFDKPLQGPSEKVSAVCLVMAGLLFSMAVGYLASFFMLAGVLRWVYGWTPARIRALMFESRIPPHWLDVPPA